MKKNNNLPAILVWIVYGLTTGCFLFLTAMSVCVKMGYRNQIGLVGGAIVLALLGGICLIAGKISQKAANKPGKAANPMVGIVLESLLVILILVLMIFVRIWLFGDPILWSVADDPVFGMVQITQQQETLPAFAHRGMELYVYLLQVSVFLLGNKPIAAVVLQFILLVFAMFGLYFGVRRGAGRLPALFVAVFLGFGSFFLEQTGILSPMLLILGFFGLAADAISVLPSKAVEGKGTAVGHALLAGILIGCSAYLDLAVGVTLLILLTGMICFGGRREEEPQVNRILLFALNLPAVVAGYMICYAVRMLLLGGKMIDAISDQMALYLPDKFRPFFVYPQESIFYGEVAIMAVLMALGIFTFWQSGRIKEKGIWLFAGLALIVLSAFGMCDFDDWNTSALFYLYAVVLAGISVEDLFYRETKTVFDDICVREQSALQERDTASDISECAEEVADTQTQEETVVRKVQLIDNPLPVPKKHVRKALDYDYEVADDDDFDIQ